MEKKLIYNSRKIKTKCLYFNNKIIIKMMKYVYNNVY